MSATLTLTDAQTIAILGNVLTAILPAGTAVIRGQANRVSSPANPSFVVMQPLMRSRLATNTDTYGATTTSRMQPTKLTVQLDVHGPNASDMAQVIQTLFRDEFVTSLFDAAGNDVQILYVEDARQISFISGEQQYEDRWSIDVVLQVNPIIATPQQSAISAVVGLIEVDAVYPPGAP